MRKKKFSKWILRRRSDVSGDVCPGSYRNERCISSAPSYRLIPAWKASRCRGRSLAGTTHGNPRSSFSPHGRYTLLQKNRTFIPHLQVIPAGSVVQFPNADPFFHNVFSLFNGKRFDLGLYEAGSSKSVTFPREGVSYIFCNIHRK